MTNKDINKGWAFSFRAAPERVKVEEIVNILREYGYYYHVGTGFYINTVEGDLDGQNSPITKAMFVVQELRKRNLGENFNALQFFRFDDLSDFKKIL